ncbi:MAG: site-2 protease family protein [Acidobacteria bacterium]|nr:site-2 protease family protein [Acidobacteriota bacterium]
MGTELIAELVIYIIVLIFAVSAHEAAHAWMSYKFGDDTARLLGRITLNPVAHVDPIGTLLIPIAGFILSGIGAGQAVRLLIGWGKPTPVNPLLWRKKDTANIMVSIAGILANSLICITSIILFKIFWQHTTLFEAGGALASFRKPVGLLFMYSIFMNASLAVFNLLPFPPLDGSRILYSILPGSMKPALEAMEQYGFLLLMGAMYFGLFDKVFSPFEYIIVLVLGIQ